MAHFLKRLLNRLKTFFGIEPALASYTAEKRFSVFTRLRLLLLAVLMAGFWYLAAPAGLSPEEDRAWETVRSAQLHLSRWRQGHGIASAPEDDPWQCGLIGPEWSELTTTLGALPSKRTACNPAWTVQFSRWFRQLGLQPGDPIAIYSSASFPGLLLNAMVAAEAMQLETLLIVSLGASTWGGNHPEVPWPVLAAELRRAGFIGKQADFHTLGGGSELGRGLSPEGEARLRQVSSDSGVKLLTAGNLEAMIIRKMELLADFEPRVLISIGGSQANLGDDPDVLKLSPGLLPTSVSQRSGNGVIGLAMRKDIPVIHLLDLKSLSKRVGIPYDGPLQKMAPVQVGAWWSIAGLLLFFSVLLTHRRWRLEPTAE